jgi:hypothetical protein
MVVGERKPKEMSMKSSILLLSIGLGILLAGIGPGFTADAEQNKDEAAKAKRIAEIQKELQELQDKIARLQAELTTLQPVAKPGPPDLAPDDKMGQGIIKSLNDQGNGFDLVNGGPKDDKRLILLTADARIMFSDKQPAKFADLKAGQSVTFRYLLLTATKSEPATLIYRSDFVIINKAKGEK